MGIPKLLYKNNATNELMNFKDIMQSESSNYRINKQFLEKNIILLRNSSEDILNMVKEQYHILRNDRKITDQEVELQKKFRNLFTKNHYSYYSESVVSYSFLNKYRYLL